MVGIFANASGTARFFAALSRDQIVNFKRLHLPRIYLWIGAMSARFLAILLLLAVWPVTGRAASDYLLVLDGIPGESTDQAHPGAIEVVSFALGVSNSVGTGTTTERPVFMDVTFTKALDKSSPLLFLHCASAKPVKRATLYLRKAGSAGQSFEYAVITLTDVLVTSVQSAGHDANIIPTESFSLQFSTIDMSYSVQKADGTADKPVRFGWDVKANVGF